MSQPTTSIPTLSPSFDSTLGPLLIGALFSMTLWGVACTQTYDYFMNNTDGRFQRSIVALLWTIDTLNSVIHSHMVYFYLVKCFANPTSLQKASWSINSHSLVAAVSNFIIRAMFAHRIYQFGKRRIIVPAWIIIISTCDLVIAIVTTAKAFQGVDLVALQNISKLLYISFALGVTADLSVTIALSWLLQSAKSGFRKSNSVVNTLMVYVVNTGLLVTLLATIGLITYIAMPHNLVFLAFFILVGKLYLNAYLATLNARGRLRTITDSDVPLSQLSVPSSNGRNAQGIVLASDDKTRSFGNSAMAISFHQSVERRMDEVSDGVKHSVSVVDSPYS